jgi:hypothetical protein
MKKIIFGFLGVVLILFISVTSFFYFGSYSKGTRSGVVFKVSERGVLFKTYEGQLNIQAFGAIPKSENEISTVFEFSVPSDRADVIKKLQEVSLSGERVNLEYEEKFFKYWWLGDTKYLVTGVQRMDKPALNP